MKRASLLPALLVLIIVLLATVLWQTHRLQQHDRSPRPSSLDAVATASAAARRQASLEGGRSLASGRNASDQSDRAPVGTEFPASSRMVLPASRQPTLNWRRVESDDYRTYVKNLRTIGCPEQTVRDIVTADVLQAFGTHRTSALGSRYGEFQYWKSDPAEAATRTEFARQRIAVDQQMGAVLLELLGEDVVAHATTREWRAAELDCQLAFLPTEKRQPVQSLLLQYELVDQQIRDLTDDRRPVDDPRELRRILQQYGEKRMELGRLLSPEESTRVEMTTSFTAENLRRAMTRFQPTEAEFQIIFRAWQPHDENLARLRATGGNDPGDLHLAVWEQLRQALTPSRYQELSDTWWK